MLSPLGLDSGFQVKDLRLDLFLESVNLTLNLASLESEILSRGVNHGSIKWNLNGSMNLEPKIKKRSEIQCLHSQLRS